jgi:geranylgeranyl pyrophosphate synthase
MPQNAIKQTLNILENYGGKTADNARRILIEDQLLKNMSRELSLVSKNWRDPLRPATIRLAFEATNGQSANAEVEKVSIAMSLMNLSFYLWDDIIDKTASRLFSQSLFGKLGEGPALIIGGVVSAKANNLLSQVHLKNSTKQKVDELILKMWITMGETEIFNLKARNEKYTSADKLEKIEKESIANFETCLRIGATIGNGLQNQVDHLGTYGRYLGIIFELQHDFQVSLNLTMELSEKIINGALPFAVLWSLENSEEFRSNFLKMRNANSLGPGDIRKMVKGVLSSGAISEIENRVEILVKKAVESIDRMGKNRASKELRRLAEIQIQRFRESVLLTKEDD